MHISAGKTDGQKMFFYHFNQTFPNKISIKPQRMNLL
jgi:hypothetical protein